MSYSYGYSNGGVFINTKSKISKSQLSKLGKFILSIVYLYIILNFINITETFNILKTIKLNSIILAFLVSILGLVIACIGWNILLLSLKIKMPFSKIFIVYLVSVSISALTPSQVGSFARPLILKVYKPDLNLKKAVSTIYTEKMISIFVRSGLLFVSTVIFLLSGLGTKKLISFLLIMLTIYSVLATILIVSSIKNDFLNNNKFKNIKILNRILLFLYESMGFVKQTIQDKNVLQKYIIVILLLNTIQSAMVTYFIMKALSINFYYPLLLIMAPIIYSTTILPISMGGLGLVEGTGIFIYVNLGLSSAEAASVIFIERLIVAYLRYLIGGIILWKIGISLPDSIKIARRA